MIKAYVALGSNIGDSFEVLQSAIFSINKLPKTKTVKTSKVYITTPIGYDDQPDFFNAVIEIETDLSANALLGALLGIEGAFGRIRKIKNGPRVLDLDLLLYGDIEMQTDELWLPHPRMMERAFVLAPLSDIAPEYKVKADALLDQGIKPFDRNLEVYEDE